jgi:hypothetical protein
MTSPDREKAQHEPREVNGKRYGLRSAIKGRTPAAA